MKFLAFKKQITSKEDALDCLKFLGEAFKFLPRFNLNQNEGLAYVKDGDPQFYDRYGYREHCGQCVGFWIAYFLDIGGAHPNQKEKKHNWQRITFEEGRSIYIHIMGLLGYDFKNAKNLLGEFGHCEEEDVPFSWRPWGVHPRIAFKKLIKHIEQDISA